MRPPTRLRAPLLLEVLEDRFLLAGVIPAGSVTTPANTTNTAVVEPTTNSSGSEVASQNTPATTTNNDPSPAYANKGQSDPQGGSNSSSDSGDSGYANPVAGNSNSSSGNSAANSSSGSTSTSGGQQTSNSPTSSNTSSSSNQQSNYSPYAQGYNDSQSSSTPSYSETGDTYQSADTTASSGMTASHTLTSSQTLQASANIVQAIEKPQAANVSAPAQGTAGQTVLLAAVGGANPASLGGVVVPGANGPADTRDTAITLPADKPNEGAPQFDKQETETPGDILMAEPLSPLTSSLLDLAPRLGNALQGALPIDWPALAQGADQFFARLESLEQGFFASPLLTRLVPWLALTAIAPLSLEMLGWRWKKPDDSRWAFWAGLLVPLPRGKS